MGSSKSAPSAPDPYQSAQAQYQYGTQAANYNAALGDVNQVTPFGSTTWSVNPSGIGTTPSGGAGASALSAAPYQAPIPSAGGELRGVQGYGATPPGYGSGTIPTGDFNANDSIAPQYTETQSLSPVEQQMLSGSQGLALQSQGLGQQAGANVGQVLNGYQMPSEGQNGLFGAQAMQAAYGTETAAMDPYWNQQEEQTDASLRNSGATPGTPAYDNAMQEFQANRANAYSQAENQAFGQGLSAQGQEISDVNQAQGGPIANFLSLIGSNPAGAASVGSAGGSGGGGGSGGVSAPNIMQAFENQYQGELANYNANVSSSNADTGALATLAAAFIASDKRLKTDIEPIGAKTPRGNALYTYRYNFQSKDQPKQVGVLAQEAEKITPDAVAKDQHGIRYVNYARA
jgi:hypothetical protein